jgi:hypothetical protein
MMKVYNKTSYDDKLIYNIMKAARVTAKGEVTAVHLVHDPELDCAGICLVYTNGECIVKLKRVDCYGIPTLAHELRHVSQASHGMSDFMCEAERTDAYSERWHEIDARMFEERYK